jgi:hypothetical protein
LLFRTPCHPRKTGGDAAFNSNGDGAGFAESANGSALCASAAVPVQQQERQVSLLFDFYTGTIDHLTMPILTTSL